MPRRGIVSKRETVPDIRYNDVLVTRFINLAHEAGEKKHRREDFLWGDGYYPEKNESGAYADV